MSEPRAGTKRSLLAQERSRDTRQAIIKAALELWSERGYATGIDEVTAEEIAARAGIAKATFYLHFARKDDILLEAGWVTTKVFYEDALKALLEGGSPDQAIDDVTVRLCRRAERVPREAMRRILRVQADSFEPRQDDSEHSGFQRGFALIILHGQLVGGTAADRHAGQPGRHVRGHVLRVAAGVGLRRAGRPAGDAA